MKYLSRIILIGATAMFSLVACSSKPSTMIASTSPLQAGVRGTIPTKATDCQYHLLGILPLTTSADSAVALDKAKKRVNVDVLTDVTVDHNSGYYLLFSNNCVRVSGLGVPRDLTMGGKSEPKVHYEHDQTSDDQTYHERTSITESDW